MGVLSLFFVGSYVMLMLGNYNGVVPYVSQINRPYDIFIEQVITEEDNEEEWIEEDEEWLEEQLRLEDDGGEYPENGGEDLGSEPAADSEYVETEAPEETEETESFDEEQFEQDLLNQLQGLS